MQVYEKQHAAAKTQYETKKLKGSILEGDDAEIVKELSSIVGELGFRLGLAFCGSSERW